MTKHPSLLAPNPSQARRALTPPKPEGRSPLTVEPLAIPDVLLITPKVFGDERGFFTESFNQRDFHKATGLDVTFVQDNHSRSRQGVLRGLHYQVKQPQGKLLRVLAGEILDVAVDVRRGSATFGQWVSARLSAENYRQMWVPEGFAHGFVVLSENAEVLYKTTDYYAPEHERAIRWDDPVLAIDWQCESWPWEGKPILSAKDAEAPWLGEAELQEPAITSTVHATFAVTT